MTFLVENLTPPDGRELRASVRAAIEGESDPDARARAALDAVLEGLAKVDPGLIWATLDAART